VLGDDVRVESAPWPVSFGFINFHVSASRKPSQQILKYTQGYHFSGISGNMEMSGNSAKVTEKSGKIMERSGNLCSQGY